MGVLRQKKVRHTGSSPKITKRRWASSSLHEASERGERVVAVLGRQLVATRFCGVGRWVVWVIRGFVSWDWVAAMGIREREERERWG